MEMRKSNNKNTRKQTEAMKNEGIEVLNRKIEN